jgi:hypothetical protein
MNDLNGTWARLLPVVATIVAGIWLTSEGVHGGPSAIGLLGGFLTAAGYMALMTVGAITLERALHPGTDWLAVVEEEPLAVALLWGAALISFALVAAVAIP